jgi:NADPH2:quinone reductase
MRAVQVTRFGGPEVLVLGELPDPTPGPGEVVVAVAAADVMFLDARLRSGWGTEFFPVRPPYVPGGAVAGEVVELGSDVDRSWLGRRVATRTAASGIGGGVPTGGYAERAVARVDTLLPIAEGLDEARAVALVHDGRTAYAVAHRAALRPGERVLITAAGGGLGLLLIQLAAAAGTTVLAAARGREKLDLAAKLGARVTVDYTDPDWLDKVRAATNGHGVDVVFDGAGGDYGRAALDVIRPGGRLLGYGGAAGPFTDGDAVGARKIELVTLREVTGSEIDWDAAARQSQADTAAGRLRVVVGRTFPLDRAADAHAAIESRATIGRTVLLV